jgi:hypothetical protein
MSCLALSELPLSEQVEIATVWAATLERRALGLLALLDPSPSTPPTGLSPGPAGGDGSIPLSEAENAAMVEKQVHDHPPLQVCYPGHRPRMWQATGDFTVRYYVECSACKVRTPRAESAELAAHAWATRSVAPIVATVDTVAAA